MSRKTTLPPTTPSTPNPELSDADKLAFEALDRLLAEPLDPNARQCIHCGAPDCPGGDDDPCVISYRAWMEEERWEAELRRMAEEAERLPANEDEEGDA